MPVPAECPAGRQQQRCAQTRHLVKDRMERAGMQWSLVGAQAMLDIRRYFGETFAGQRAK
ncbi:MAG: hypothetical protein HC800_09560 [Phormidesmis sp. RL_2_1]|nr:hypothetical protein [Phormidesmis sp. RL_2_1]